MSDQPKVCRTCRKTSNEVWFARTSKHLCGECDGIRKQARNQRIAQRGPRVVVVLRKNLRKNPRHIGFVESLSCCVCNFECRGDIVAHHVRRCTGAGTALKPDDIWTIPVCFVHHAEIHHGDRTFEAKYVKDLRAVAIECQRLSPFVERIAA